MNKTILGKIFILASSSIMFAMLFSPSASVVRYVLAEDINPPLVEEVVNEEFSPIAEEEPSLVEDSFICDVNTNPVISNSKGFYLEYTYGVDANLLTILADLQVSASDPNNNLVSFFQESITNLVGGVSTLNVGTYYLQYFAVDSDGCTDQEQITIVVNPAEDLVCDETNSPVITLPNNFYHYPTSTGFYPYLSMSSDIHTVNYHDPSDPDVFLNYSNNIDKIFSGVSGVPIGIYNIVHNVLDPIGCTDTENVTVVVGPMCQVVAPNIKVAHNTVVVKRNANLEDILNKAGFEIIDATSDLFTPHFTTDFNSNSTNQSGTFILKITAVEDNELCISGVQEIEVIVSDNGSNSSGSSTSSGTVLGVTTGGEVLGATTCEPYLKTYMRKGIANDIEEVKKLQTFLNQEMNAGLPITGLFKNLTDQAVRNFQNKYKKDILVPWGATKPTGLVYKTTQTKINNIMCAELNLPIPTDLIPFSQYLKTL